jgi:hypothetical protein
MEKNCVILRRRLLEVEICYNLQGEVLMTGRSAKSLQSKLTEIFPRDTYLVFKEVKDNAKKGNSIIKNSGIADS